MNTLRNRLLVSLFGLTLAVAPVLRAAESPAQDGLTKDVAESRPDTSGQSVPRSRRTPAAGLAKRQEPTLVVGNFLHKCPLGALGLRLKEGDTK